LRCKSYLRDQPINCVSAKPRHSNQMAGNRIVAAGLTSLTSRVPRFSCSAHVFMNYFKINARVRASICVSIKVLKEKDV
jgi:hypothetical protein